MARPSTKKVTRAAQTGGGRTARGSRPWLYWGVIMLVVVLGTITIAYSREQRRDEIAAGSSLTPPKAGKDHWHAAYGIYVCDHFLSPFTDQRDPEGIHTHGDGIIHIHPTVRRAAGTKARLQKFFDALKIDIDDTSLEVPGDKTYTEGDDKCDGKPGVMQLKIKGREGVITTDIAEQRFTADRMVMTIAFAPKGAEIPLPPSEPKLDDLSDVGPGSGATTQTSIQVTQDTTGTTTPGAPTDSTAPPDTSANTTPTSAP